MRKSHRYKVMFRKEKRYIKKMFGDCEDLGDNNFVSKDLIRELIYKINQDLENKLYQQTLAAKSFEQEALTIEKLNECISNMEKEYPEVFKIKHKTIWNEPIVYAPYIPKLEKE